MSLRCAYFLQSHRDPQQVYRLVRTLKRGSPEAVVVVQHNAAACDLDLAPLADLADVHLLRVPYRQVRGNWSCQVQPTLDGIAWLERERIAYDWLVTLTAQDYPTKPLAESERIYAESPADGFLRHWDIESSASPWPLHKPKRRYWYQYRRLDDAAMRWLPAAKALSHVLPGVFVSLYYGPYVGVRGWRTPWKNGFRCYGGWAWGALRREAVRYVVDFLDANPELVAFYRRVMSPEESILQTVLCNSGRFTLVDDDFRYLDYAGSKTGSPRVITVDDVPGLAAGPWCFARKFDLAVDREVLDRIDVELLGGA